MESRPNPDSDRYGDGDVPEADYEPYRDNHFDPHPQAEGGFRDENKNKQGNAGK